jgi:4'-phosphopantetheinyl transferase
VRRGRTHPLSLVAERALDEHDAERAWGCLRPHLRLWWVELDVQEDARRELAGLLSPAERRRAVAFRFDRDRRRFEVARASLRLLLGLQMDVSAANVGIVAGPRGKPCLADPATNLSFNVSHADEAALVCMSAGLEVGVDLEAMREIPDAVALAQRYFSPSEAVFVSSGAEREQAGRFLGCWTRKEAVVKGVGDGLSMPLGGFSVPLLSPVGAVGFADESAARWLVAGFPLGGGYLAAVAARLPPAAEAAALKPLAPYASARVRLEHCRPVDLSAVLGRDSGGGR